jgi:hypothetical protein
MCRLVTNGLTGGQTIVVLKGKSHEIQWLFDASAVQRGTVYSYAEGFKMKIKKY